MRLWELYACCLNSWVVLPQALTIGWAYAAMYCNGQEIFQRPRHVYQCALRCIMREDFSLKSRPLGELAVGEQVGATLQRLGQGLSSYWLLNST
jgi:hypothetical protein